MLILLLTLTSLATALLSGVFGMAGGMILMGAFTALLPVPTAMVLHGSTQLVSNVSRAYILRTDIHWRSFSFYIVGSLAAFGIMLGLRYSPPPLLVFLGLGATPFVAACVPRGWLDFERPPSAVLTGFLVAAMQLVAGAAGPLLDVAFVNTRFQRNQVVATKAVTQVFSHALKLVYFAPALESDELSPQLLAALLVATIAGTRLGTWLLQRMSDAAFRRYTRAIIYAVGSVYLCKAGLLLLSSPAIMERMR